jgi:hypothetical protein
MDMNIVYTILILFFGMITAFLLARWLDPFWRTKQLRKWLKKNYFLIYIVSVNGSRVTPHVINVDNGSIKHDDQIWICENGKIIEEGKPEFQINLKKLEPKFIKWRDETVPTMYVSADSLVPLEFDKFEREVNPKTLSNVLKSAYINESSRHRMQVGNNYLTIILVLCFATLLFTGYVAYVQYNFMNDITEGNIVIQKTIPVEKTGIDTTTNLPSQKQDDKIVITT